MFYFRQALVHSDQHDVLNSTFYTDLGTAMIQDTLCLHAGLVISLKISGLCTYFIQGSNRFGKTSDNDICHNDKNNIKIISIKKQIFLRL